MKPKTKKKKQTPLQRIQKLLDKLAALHEKEEEIVQKIEEIICDEEEQMPIVGNKKYPYTKVGIKKAKKHAETTGQKMVKKYKSGVGKNKK